MWGYSDNPFYLWSFDQGGTGQAGTGKTLLAQTLARMLDVRVPTVSDRETSSVGVPWETWLAVAFVLDLPAEWEPTAGSTDDKPVR